MAGLQVSIAVEVTMAKLRPNQWGTIFANVFTRGRTLEREATRLGLTESELIAMGDKKFPRSDRWNECKRISSKRKKKIG